MRKNILAVTALLGCMAILCTGCGIISNLKSVDNQVNNEQFTLEGGFDVSFEEVVAADNEWAEIIVKGVDKVGENIQIEVSIHNRHNEKLNFIAEAHTLQYGSVNGYMLDDMLFFEEVPAGGKVTKPIIIDMEELELYGITELSDIRFKMDAFTDGMEGFETDLIVLQSSIYEAHNYEQNTYIETIKDTDKMQEMGYTIYDICEEKVFSDKGVELVSQTLLETPYDYEGFYIEVKNNTDEFVKCQLDDLHINGILVHEYLEEYDVVAPGATKVFKFEYFIHHNEELPELKDFEEIKYTFKVYEEYGRDEISSKDIVYTVKDN